MTDLSTGREASTFSIELDRLDPDPSDAWCRIATSIIEALACAPMREGEVVVFGRIGVAKSSSTAPSAVLHLMFVDPSPGGLSKRQITAIHRTLKAVGARVEGRCSVPDDSVPIFVQLNGSVMRIARPDDEGGWVRFVLARPAGSWAIVAAAVEGRDGLVVAEPGIELPLAMVRRTPIRLDLPVLRLPGGEPLHAWLNLGLVAAQFGPVAWMMLQEHLVRVVERAAAPSASLVIRMVVGEREAAMFLEFLYDGLRVDLADMLAEVFADFSSKPVFVTATKPLGAAIPLFATEGGTLFILATGDDGRSAPVLKVQRKRATLGFERLPDGEGIHFALRQVRILDDSGMGTVDVERQVVLRIAKMWTA